MTPRRPAAGPSRPAPLIQQIANEVRAGIKTGTYPKGGLLPSERALAKQHRASRGTARAALVRLVADGIAEAVHGVGYRVVRLRRQNATTA